MEALNDTLMGPMQRAAAVLVHAAMSDGAGRLKPPRFTSPLGCCRCGRQRDAVGRELFEGRIRSDTVSGAVSCVAP